MKVIKEAKNTTVCDRCHAELEFTSKDVIILRSLTGASAPGSCVECPCCKNIIWVWR
jgi:uncharacterized protein with PIN domain